MTLARKIVIAMAVFVLGFVVGWKVCGWKHGSDTRRQAQQQTQEIAHRAGLQIKQRAKEEKREQGLSANLLDMHHTIDTQGDALQEQIQNVHFHLPKMQPVSAVPDLRGTDPAGTRQFMQLYDEAARGGAPAAAATAQSQTR